MSVKIRGLESAMAAMRAAFPSNPKQQRSLLNQAMSGSAKKSIIPIAKQMALRGDSSGSLSEAIAPRAVSLSRARSKGVSASVHITPVRSNRRAMAMYINYYYTQRGKIAPATMVTSGIRHGHLVEFGTVKTPAYPFLWPALQSQRGNYVNQFSSFLKKRTESAVRRKARRRGRR